MKTGSVLKLNNVLGSHQQVMDRVAALSSGRLRRTPGYHYSSRASALALASKNRKLVPVVDEFALLELRQKEEREEERRKAKRDRTLGKRYVNPKGIEV